MDIFSSYSLWKMFVVCGYRFFGSELYENKYNGCSNEFKNPCKSVFGFVHYNTPQDCKVV